MRILQIHNSYQSVGGEDRVVVAERQLLRARGHIVECLMFDNDSISTLPSRIKAAVNLVWSRHAYERTLRLVREFRPSLVHVHNFFPLATPSVYDAARACGVPVVQTLHNYRVICPTSSLLLDGVPCERSLHRSSYWMVPRKVYRQSYIGTFALARMIEHHKARGTWQNKVDAYITLTPFSRRKFIEAGFPAARLHVKPNFCYDNEPVQPLVRRDVNAGGFMLYVGRLSEEKGLAGLISVFTRSGLPLKIVGDGPMAERLGNLPANIDWLGWRPAAGVRALMEQAMALVVPSLWYEGFPLVIAEAFCVGLPVIASRLGALEDIVIANRNGLLAEPGDSEDWLEVCNRLWQDQPLARRLSVAARRDYVECYTPERNYTLLDAIYRQALGSERI